MAEDGMPKDYSRVYSEDLKSVPPIWSDGARSYKHRESTVDLRAVVAKLKNLPPIYATDTLKNHYTSFITKSEHQFKAYMKYHNEKDTYVVRVNHNTLKAVKEKAPKRGNFRYFFKGPDNTCEEVEFDDSILPYHEKGGLRHIYCQIFSS